MGVSSLRVGVAGFEPEGELKRNSRCREGVVGGAGVVEGPRRSGEASRALGGVTSEWRIELKSVLACSGGGQGLSASEAGFGRAAGDGERSGGTGGF